VYSPQTPLFTVSTSLSLSETSTEMLALALDDAESVSRAEALFQRLGSSVFVASAGSPAGNGHVAAKQKTSIVVFDLRSDVDEELLELKAFNVTPRQAGASVKKRDGFFTEPSISPEVSQSKAFECIRYHIRMAQERVKMLPMLRSSSRQMPPRKNSRETMLEKPPVQIPFIKHEQAAVQQQQQQQHQQQQQQQQQQHIPSFKVEQDIDVLNDLLPAWMLDDLDLNGMAFP
jgi:hypothetical protein